MDDKQNADGDAGAAIPPSPKAQQALPPDSAPVSVPKPVAPKPAVAVARRKPKAWTMEKLAAGAAAPTPAPVSNPVAPEAAPIPRPRVRKPSIAAIVVAPAPKSAATVPVPAAKPTEEAPVPSPKDRRAIIIARRRAIIAARAARALAPVMTVPATPIASPIARGDTILLPRLRARTRSMAMLSFYLFVILPTICAGWYYFKIATPMYVSDAQIAFKKGDQLLNSGTGDFLSAVMGMGAGGTASPDSLIVVAYLRSPEAMRDADAALDLRRHYSDPETDFLSRLSENATQDKFFRYWKGIVNAKMNVEYGLLELSVKAFSPEMSRSLSSFLFTKCEEKVNQLNDRLRSDHLQQAMSEVARAELKVSEASKELESFRVAHNILDLESDSAIRMRVIGDLEAERTRIKAEIEAKRSFFSEEHIEIRTLRSKFDALGAQLAEERGKIASEAENEKSIAAMAAEYERKTTGLTFARRVYEMAVSTLEAARVQSDTKTTYVVPVSRPALPDEALYPKPARSTGIFFLANLVAFGFISMLYASLREHLGL